MLCIWITKNVITQDQHYLVVTEYNPLFFEQSPSELNGLSPLV